MSLNYFCPSCGKKTPYQFTKPLFCSSCGLRFSDLEASASTRPAPTPIVPVRESPFKPVFKAPPRRASNFVEFEDEDADDEDLSEQFAHMTGLDVIVQRSAPPRGESLRDLANQKPEEFAPRSTVARPRGRPKRKLAVTASNLPKEFVAQSSQRGRGAPSQDIDLGGGEE